jgi:hypothetical protein
MIPKIFHYVWVGGPMPQAQHDYIASWRETNPDFEIIRWDEQNIDMSQPIIQRAYAEKKWAKVADIARLQAVAEHGGIYLDTDFRLFKSVAPLLQHSCFCAFQQCEDGADWVCNGVFGAEPGHWFVKQVRDALFTKKQSRFLPERPTAFGPKHITRLLRDAGLRHYSPCGVMVKDIYVTPVPVFFPFAVTETFTPACITPETIAAHFWEKSWEASIPLPIRITKRVVKKVQGALTGSQAAR